MGGGCVDIDVAERKGGHGEEWESTGLFATRSRDTGYEIMERGFVVVGVDS